MAPRSRSRQHFALLAVAAACSSDAEDPDLGRLRDELLQKIQASSCPADPCPVVSFTARPATERDRSRGKRILLIDDAIVLPAVTRWPGRVIGLLALGSDGSYAATTPEFVMARDAVDVLATIAAFPRPVRGTALDLVEPFFTRFSPKLPPEAFGHGMDILPFLAEHLPSAQFVLSEDQLEAPTRCELLDIAPDDLAWASHDDFVERMSRSLAKAIVDHGINYVHLSWGLGHSEISRAFESRCGRAMSVATARRFMEPYVALLSSLTALATPDERGRPRPVMIFQAGATGIDPDARRLDCADIARRLRVFSVPYTGMAVSPEGSHDESLLPAPLAELGCNDVFIVMGYTGIFEPTRGDMYFPSMPFGLGRAPRPSWPPAPSFANPIGLAHFVHIAERHPDESIDQWSARLTDGWTQPIIDPLLHDPELLPATP